MTVSDLTRALVEPCDLCHCPIGYHVRDPHPSDLPGECYCYCGRGIGEFPAFRAAFEAAMLRAIAESPRDLWPVGLRIAEAAAALVAHLLPKEATG